VKKTIHLLKVVGIVFATFLFNMGWAQDTIKEKKAAIPIYTSLKKALRNADNVEWLNLSNTKLKEFPEGIFKLNEKTKQFSKDILLIYFSFFCHSRESGNLYYKFMLNCCL